MLFKPVLIDKIERGAKTQTRRLTTHRDGKPLRYQPGHEYAVQPGRGKPHVGHIRVDDATVEPLGDLTVEDAFAEGFGCPVCFRDYWTALHGRYDRAELVAVVRFSYAGRRPCCVRVEAA